MPTRMKLTTTLAAGVFTTALAAGVLAAELLGGAVGTATAAPALEKSVSAQASAGDTAAAAAGACLRGAWKYDGTKYAPMGTGYYVTTDRCADIQVKADRDTRVKLCYLKDRDPNKETCNRMVTAKAGQWKVLGRDFRDGVYFYLDFVNSNAHKTGLVAG
ncbi:hypothetical protein SSP35_22_00080 [Streptomyces sp. NBRC 110611]|uniref:hypothetical protein n=1 Tax=Streptomyces sp. NBRC 110611 TaxID=1621259 RepID=UPI000858F8DC|nr:hypothetical protein [Streptomyces sp. NBRC 110611]GAU70705.1 hypothetical protein SSP35_22_00080 [Streptomyces sp. NBRC 110611]